MRPVRRIAIELFVAVLVLCAAAAPAAAKEMTVKVCGATECMRTSDPGTVGPLHSTFAPSAAPSAAPFYVVSFEQGGREAWSYVYVPSALAMRSDSFGRGSPRWQDATLLRPSLPDLTRLEPLPASGTWRLPAGEREVVLWAPFPAAAAAAEVVRVCGASACAETAAPRQVGPLTSNIGAPAAAPDAAPFYVVSFEAGGRELWSYVYVPSAGAMRSDEFGHGSARWRDVPPEIASAMPDVTGLEPHAASASWTTGRGGPPAWPLAGAAGAALLALALLLRRAPTRRRFRPVRPALP